MEEIEFADNFDENIDTIIFPPNLKKISLGRLCTGTMNNLPVNLEILSCEQLNTSLTNLPIGLRKIIIIKNSMDDKYSYYKNLLKYMVKIPFGCVVSGLSGNILDLETIFV